MTEMSKVEEVARAIHPNVFKSHASLYAYCLGNGDSQEEAEATANFAHPLDESFAVARAAIAAMSKITESEAYWIAYAALSAVDAHRDLEGMKQATQAVKRHIEAMEAKRA